VTPRVTVLTATYNQAAFVRTCVESVLSQTMPDWEMVAVDDGSTDGTPDAVRAFRDPRIRVLGLEHAGIERLHDRYNRALEEAACPLVAVLEGDDAWPREKLEIQVARMERDDAVVSFGACDIRDRAGRILSRQRPLLERANGRRMAELLLTHSSAMPFSPTVIVRAAALRSLGGFRQTPYLPLVDFPTWLELTRLGDFRGHPEVLGFYRFYADSVSNRRRRDVIDGLRRYSLEFLARHPDLRALRRRVDGLHAYATALHDLENGRGARAFRGLAAAARLASPAMRVRAVGRILQGIVERGRILSRV